MLLAFMADPLCVKRSPPADHEQSSFPTPPAHTFPQQFCNSSVVSGVKTTNAANQLHCACSIGALGVGEKLQHRTEASGFLTLPPHFNSHHHPMSDHQPHQGACLVMWQNGICAYYLIQCRKPQTLMREKTL